MWLPQGSYEVKVSLSLDGNISENVGSIDVATASGSNVLANIPLIVRDFESGEQPTVTSFIFPFTLVEDTSDIEFRVRTTESMILFLQDVSVRLAIDD